MLNSARSSRRSVTSSLDVLIARACACAASQSAKTTVMSAGPLARWRSVASLASARERGSSRKVAGVSGARRTFASSAEDAEARNLRDDNVNVDLDAKIPKKSNPKVAAIADQVCELTLLEVNELCDVLAERLGLGDMSGMMFGGGMMPHGGGGAATGGGGAGGAAAAAAPVEEKTSFTLKLESFDAAQKIKVIKEVRGITDLGLKEAKDLVEGVPAVLKKDLKKEEAEALMKKLTEAGAKCVLE